MISRKENIRESLFSFCSMPLESLGKALGKPPTGCFFDCFVSRDELLIDRSDIPQFRTQGSSEEGGYSD